MAVQGGIAVLCSFFIFPESIGHSFQVKLVTVVEPLHTALQSIHKLFVDVSPREPSNSSPRTALSLDDWVDKSQNIRQQLLQSLSGVPPLRAQQRYLSVDFSFSRLSGHDLRDLFDCIVGLQARSSGLSFFFDVIINNARHQHLDSSAFSVHQASQSRPPSRPASIHEVNVRQQSELENHSDDHDTHVDQIRHDGRRFHFPAFLHRRSGSPNPLQQTHKGSYSSLMDHMRKVQEPVGVYESQRYMDVERSFTEYVHFKYGADISDPEQILEQLNLLANASLPLVMVLERSLSAVVEWLTQQYGFPWSHRRDTASDTVRAKSALVIGVKADLEIALQEFHSARLVVVKPYSHLFDSANPQFGESKKFKVGEASRSPEPKVDSLSPNIVPSSKVLLPSTTL